ncbi:MAG: V-type ATP synthase subunit F [Candidatus Altiarchaeota archaeon]|nr:V-type ATP synthase subunit F [Candidatus Altiarchaeota archaeon]
MASKRLIVLGGRDAVSGMRLAGVRESYFVDKSNFSEVYEKVRDSDSMFFITEEAAKLLGPRVEELRSRTLVQVIPETAVKYSVIRDLIKDTV